MSPFNRTLWNWNKVRRRYNQYEFTFNRTLWNWNLIRGTRNLLRLAFNRTLWNWNCVLHWCGSRRFILLIVPYGIETTQMAHLTATLLRLLIVPYGIETRYEWACKDWCKATFNRTLWNWNLMCISLMDSLMNAFNRTLWNWNFILPLVMAMAAALLIVPYGIETYYHRKYNPG